MRRRHAALARGPALAQLSAGRPSGAPQQSYTSAILTFLVIEDAGETLVVAAAGAPVFLGAWRGRHPINVQCGACGYTGQSVLKKKWGAAATTWAVMTLGFGAPWGKVSSVYVGFVHTTVCLTAQLCQHGQA